MLSQIRHIYDTVKPCKEESKKLRANRLFFKVLHPLDKNQCKAVVVGVVEYMFQLSLTHLRFC